LFERLGKGRGRERGRGSVERRVTSHSKVRRYMLDPDSTRRETVFNNTSDA
jgi:hypothetical protein